MPVSPLDPWEGRPQQEVVAPLNRRRRTMLRSYLGFPRDDID
jgi:hypothetical protein